jgi:hypothetical protein
MSIATVRVNLRIGVGEWNEYPYSCAERMVDLFREHLGVCYSAQFLRYQYEFDNFPSVRDQVLVVGGRYSKIEMRGRIRFHFVGDHTLQSFRVYAYELSRRRYLRGRLGYCHCVRVRYGVRGNFFEVRLWDVIVDDSVDTDCLWPAEILRYD